MPRAPNVKKSEAEKLFRKGMKLAEIAKKLDVPEGTVRSWKNRGKWAEKDRKKNPCNVAVNETETNATLQKKKRGGQPGNQNAKGSKGGAAPLRNHNAEKHGFFSKYLPEDSLDIIDELKEKGQAEILWENIQLSYAAILRAQKIMFVPSKEEMIKEIKRVKKKKGRQDETEVEWEFQFAWDRQAAFLAAQARAMSELRALLRQYENIMVGEQKARVEKIRAETERIKDAAEGNGYADDWIEEALREKLEHEDERQFP